MKLIKLLKINALAGLILLSTGMALPPDDLTFDDFDKDGNALISRSEFVDVFTFNYVDDWNTTDNDYLDDEDFFQVVYRVWDVDHDNKLTDQEWKLGYENYFRNYVVARFEDIDVDDDSYIMYSEYYDLLGDTDFYAAWDFDGDLQISQAELARGVFNNWDMDNSGFLDRGEFNAFDIYYLDI